MRTDLEKLKWTDIAGEGPYLKPGYTINKAELLFSKIEDNQIEKQLEKLEKTKMDNKVPVASEAGTSNDSAAAELKISASTEMKDVATYGNGRYIPITNLEEAKSNLIEEVKKASRKTTE